MTGRTAATEDIAGDPDRLAAPRQSRVRSLATALAMGLALVNLTLPLLLRSAGSVAAAAPPAADVIWAARDLETRAWLARERPDNLDTPIAPGSVYKVVTLAAALELSVVTPGTGITCSRGAAAALAVPPCSHADLHRPLRVTDALAHSCNVFAATAARRLTRTAFDRILRDLHLPPSDPSIPLPMAALGLGGVAASPTALLTMMSRIALSPTPLPWSAPTLATIRDGLTQAARVGTASTSEGKRLDLLAKTGTVVIAGRPRGLVAGVFSEPDGGARNTKGGGDTSTNTSLRRRIAFVLVAPGATGAEAAVLAAERLAALSGHVSPAPPFATAGRTVRIGVPRDDGGYDVRGLLLDDYVAGVVAGEAAVGSPASALEALAITARTFAVANRERHRADGFDLCTLTHCQVLRPATPATTAATMATREGVLVREGRVAQVFFSASCGGRSARPSEVWPAATDPEYLPSHDDAACAGAPAWHTELRAADVVRALRAGGFRGDRLLGLRVVSRTPSGRAAVLAVDGFVPPTVPAETFRSLVGRTLGWNLLKSTAFDIAPTGVGYRFAGRGAGHGVGLCVVGSVARAAQGDTAAGILAHYFPGLTVAPASAVGPAAPAARVVVVVPHESRPDENRVRLLATRVLEELSGELNVPAPPTLTLRFHPTVESYGRATGRQWFTSGAMVGATEAAFIPLDVLARRGTLDATIRHELVHVLTAASYRDRALWVSEGAAVYFSTPPSERRQLAGRATEAMRCPADDDLRRPRSRAALGEAYGHAAACFARAVDARVVEARAAEAGVVDAGRAWRRVGE